MAVVGGESEVFVTSRAHLPAVELLQLSFGEERDFQNERLQSSWTKSEHLGNCTSELLFYATPCRFAAEGPVSIAWLRP